METLLKPATEMAAEDMSVTYRHELVGEPIAFLALRTFDVTTNNITVPNKPRLEFHTVSFGEFAARYPDCDKGFVTCFQWGADGREEEKQLAVWDFIREVFYTTPEPYFTEKQRIEYKSSIEETLLNIIDSRF